MARFTAVLVQVQSGAPELNNNKCAEEVNEETH